MKRIVVLLIVLLITAGCSIKPHYYSDSYVRKYVKNVFGSSYELKEKRKYISNENDIVPGYEYVYGSKDGLTFSVFTYAYHEMMDSSKTIFYSKGIKDNYTNTMISYYNNDINKILNDMSFGFELKNHFWRFYLDNYNQLNEVSNSISKIDHLLQLKYDDSEYTSRNYKHLDIYVYLKPDNYGGDSDWKSNSNYMISSVRLSNNEKNRLTYDSVFKKIEGDLANRIKVDKVNYYSLPDDVLLKYPARFVKITKINNVVNLDWDYRLEYDNGNYWIFNLNPCNDYLNSHRYDGTGWFSKLIELLGGTYEIKNGKMTWKINGITWKAYINGISKNYCIIKRNNKRLKLSSADRDKWKTPYTKEDVEKLLNVRIKIDQRNAVASIIKQ